MSLGKWRLTRGHRRKGKAVGRWWAGAIVLVLLILFSLPSFWRWVAPFPYRESICAQAERVGLDPCLVAAVIRVESGFVPGAESPQGARGLMQLMPETGRWVAARLGMAFDPAYLFDPHYNLRLGTWYLAHLLQEFDGNLVAALAAYNGGWGHVHEWLKQHQWSGHVSQLERIPFPETRQFVARVLRHYHLYRRLYGAPEAEEWKGWLAKRSPR